MPEDQAGQLDEPVKAAPSGAPMPPHERSSLVTWIGLSVIALLTLVYLAIRPARQDRMGVQHPAVGEPLPLLELAPLTGEAEPVSLRDLHGKVTLINFWGFWCPPCVEEFPHLAAVWQKLRGEPDFLYLSVASLGGDDVQDVEDLREGTETFLQRQRVDHLTYRDAGFATRSALELMLIFRGYPTTIVLDRRAVIRGVWTGYDPEDAAQMERLLLELLADQ